MDGSLRQVNRVLQARSKPEDAHILKLLLRDRKPFDPTPFDIVNGICYAGSRNHPDGLLPLLFSLQGQYGSMVLVGMLVSIATSEARTFDNLQASDGRWRRSCALLAIWYRRAWDSTR